MPTPAPFDDDQVVALLTRISQRAAQTLRDARQSGANGPQTLGGSLASAEASQRYGRRRSDRPRTAPQVRTLNAQAVALLQLLPPQIRLVALRGAFPRIVNHIAAVWDDPKAFDTYLDSLLIDTRGKRQGFPFPVVAELTELRAYHIRHVRPSQRS